MRKFYFISSILFVFLFSFSQVFALNKDEAINQFQTELEKITGMTNAGNRAENSVNALINQMEGEQYDIHMAIKNLESQVLSLTKKSNRKDEALTDLDNAKTVVSEFDDLDASEHIRVQTGLAGTLPYVLSDDVFSAKKDEANALIRNLRRTIINPDRPGSVPEGDIVSDFIPQIIRQLFRFVWVAIFIALTVSGVFFVVAQDNDERITKAKSMLYLSLVGFAFVAFAFAIVKAVTDIDFFRFI